MATQGEIVMRFKALAVALAAAFVLSGGVGSAAENPVVFQPASPWQMDYSDDSCALRRLFKVGEDRVVLDLRQFAPNSSMMATVMADKLPRAGRPVRFRYEPATEWRDADTAMYAGGGEQYEGFGGFLFTADILPHDDNSSGEDGRIDPEEAPRLAQAFKTATGFSIAGGFGRDVTLNTGSLDAPYDAMRTCLDELVTHWGVDAEAHKSLTRRAAPRDINVIIRRLQRDYPITMLQKGLSALIRFRLSIDDKGAVSGCKIQLDISRPEFERTACENMAGAKFDPALDKDGKPIASYWVNAVIYQAL